MWRDRARMAMITQAGVDKLTAGLRAGFDAENEESRRARRLRRAARGRSFDPEQERRENLVELERRSQQAQDIGRAEQGVRQRYAFDPVFSGPTQLFDAGDVSTLPASVLARHGSMAPAEMVRTERQRVNAAGGTWGAAEEFDAGRALGSRSMMQRAAQGESMPSPPEVVARRSQARATDVQFDVDEDPAQRIGLGRVRETLHQARRRGEVSFDPGADPLSASTELEIKRSATNARPAQGEGVTRALAVRRSLVAPTFDLQEKEAAKEQRAEDRQSRIESQRFSSYKGRSQAAEDIAKRSAGNLAAFDKSPEGQELAGLRRSIARDEQLAGEKLGPVRALFDFGRQSGDSTPEAEQASERVRQSRARLDALQQRRDRLERAAKEGEEIARTARGDLVGAIQNLPTRSFDLAPADQKPTPSPSRKVYASPFASEIADLDRVISSRTGDGTALEQAGRRRLRLQAMELQDMLDKGVITQEEADRRAAVLLGR